MKTVTTAQGRYRGVSAADRQRERRGRLLDAALEIMAADQWRAATVEKVAQTAGLNKRYFYESFADLDVLAAAVVEDIATEIGEATMAAFTGALAEPIERQALLSVDALVRVLVRDPRRARVLLGGVAATPAMQARRTAVMNGLTQILVTHARLIHGVELESDPLAHVAPAYVMGGHRGGHLGVCKRFGHDHCRAVDQRTHGAVAAHRKRRRRHSPRPSAGQWLMHSGRARFAWGSHDWPQVATISNS